MVSQAVAREATSAPARPGSALAPVVALLLGTALMYVGQGLQSTLVPLRADVEGFSRVEIGLLASTYYAGFVVGCFVAPYLILRSGHIRAFAAMVSVVSAAAVCFPLVTSAEPWMAFRFGTGFCIAGLLVIIESWLNDKATNTTRGVIMSAYVVVTYAAISVGQLGVALAPIEAFTLFALCSIIMSVAAVPVALTRSTQPAPIALVRFEPLKLYRTAPAGVVGVFAAGFMTSSLLNLGVIYAVDIGLRTNEAAFFVAACLLGGAFGQYPFGRVSDFVDRRLVLLVAVAASAGLCVLMVFATAVPDLAVVVLGFAIGLVVLPVYSIAAAHAFDWTEREDMVSTSAGLLVVFGVGSMIGPFAASALMPTLGPSALFLTIGLAALALAAFVAVRLYARRRPAEELRSDYDYYSTAPVGGALTPHPLDEDDPALMMPAPLSPAGADADADPVAPGQAGDTIVPAQAIEPLEPGLTPSASPNT